MDSRAIFFDPTRRRWKWVRAAALITGGVTSGLLLGLLASFFLLPERGQLFTPVAEEGGKGVLPALPSLTPTPAEILERKRLQHLMTSRAVYEKAHAESEAHGTLTVAAFFSNDDPASFTSLKENLPKIDLLFPEWMTLKKGGAIAYGDPDYMSQITGYIRRRSAATQIMPVVSNLGDTGYDHDAVNGLLTDKKAQSRFFEAAVAWILQNHFDGLVLDLQEMGKPAEYAAFVEETAQILHIEGLKLVVVVPADAGSVYPYAGIASAADLVALPLYDEHYETPGPIASVGWTANILEARSAAIPRQKLLPIIGTHSYDWAMQGKIAQLPVQETFEEALLTAKESDATITFDPLSLAPSYEYYDDRGALHQVSMQDAATAFNEYRLVQQYAPRVGMWQLGAADSALWSFLGGSGAPTPSAFERLQFNYLIDYEGQGEILQLLDSAAPGTRFISYNAATGLIGSESYDAFPSPYLIDHYGAAQKEVALTFDDGPDDRYTPDILDILEAKRVPAAFFVIGENAQRFPDLVKREYDEGHIIGNHTYTHPNIANISLSQLSVELSSTERLIESITGHQATLFRAPYAADGEPQTPDQMVPALVASKDGYVFVGMNIDPQDWQATSSQAIVTSVISQVVSGKGNIILLHDGGADRTRTVAALPQIIDALRAQGFTFVSVANLAGKPPAALMPPVPPAQKIALKVDAWGFAFLRGTTETLRFLFIAAIVLGVARFFLLGPLAVREYVLARRKKFSDSYAPSVAVVIAAFNEEKVIVKTVEHVLASRLPGSDNRYLPRPKGRGIQPDIAVARSESKVQSHFRSLASLGNKNSGSTFEVIVVNDGSKDATEKVLQERFGNHPDVHIYSKENAGKARALNYGLAHTSAEIIITLDADTLFLPDTTQKLVRHFVDPEVAGVAGNAKVGNRLNMLTRWQALEYITSQNLDKRAFSLLNCIIVVPGAVGAWRRSVIEELGFFATDTLAEDTDLTLAVEKRGYKVRYEDGALGLTEAPDTPRALIKQRYRWTYGTYQAVWKHRDAFLNPKAGWLGFVTLPNILIFQVLLPLLSPILDLFVFVTAFSLYITWAQHPEDIILVPILSVLFYYCLFLAFDYLIALVAFMLEEAEDWRLLGWLFLQRFYYRQLMYYIAIKSIVSSLRGGAVGWNKLERKATVNVNPKPSV